MSKTQFLGRAPIGKQPIPAPAFIAETPLNRYKSCLNEQTAIGGKKACAQDFLGELSEDKSS
jgi:hypothetical protein